MRTSLKLGWFRQSGKTAGASLSDHVAACVFCLDVVILLYSQSRMLPKLIEMSDKNKTHAGINLDHGKSLMRLNTKIHPELGFLKTEGL